MITLLLTTSAVVAWPWEFTFSDGNNQAQANSALNQSAITFILSAQSSVDVAIYNLSDTTPNGTSITDALVSQRFALGAANVRVITDTDNFGNQAIQDLQNVGITVVDDQGDIDEMHNKFIVVDGTRVWTSTANFTNSGFSSQDNAALRIDDAAIAGVYQGEFDEMWAGTFKEASPPTQVSEFDLGGRPVRVLFSPEDSPISDTQVGLRSFVQGATESVVFLAYVFSGEIDGFTDLEEDLVAAFQAGRTVRGVFERDIHEGVPPYDDDGPALPQMNDLGMDVVLDNNASLMHAKAAVIDQRTVMFGSANFTWSADTFNDENVVFLTDPRAARRIVKWVNRLYIQGSDTPPSNVRDAIPPAATTGVAIGDGPGAGTALISWNTAGEPDLSLAHVFVDTDPIVAADIALVGALDPVASVPATDGSVQVDLLSDGSPLPDNVDLYAAVVVTDTATNESPLGGGSVAGPTQVGPGGMVLSGPVPGISGTVNTWTLTGAAPNATAHLVYALQPGTTNVPGCPGLTVGLASPKVLGAVTTDGNGDATWVFDVPLSAFGKTAWFQSAVLSACEVSNRIEHTF